MTLEGIRHKNLLWTGGWDSTFRLLHLLVKERKVVRPFYVLDHHRRSTGVEVQTIHTLKRMILKQFPHTAELLMPVRYINVEAIPPDENIQDTLKYINKFMTLGSQHGWLARFCQEEGIYDMELCILKSRNPKQNLGPVIEKVTRENQTLQQQEYRETAGNELEKNIQILFRYFKTPLLNMSKKDMLDIAKKNGWFNIMKHTWFCHEPRYTLFSGIEPCGVCPPCSIAISHDFGWRIPAHRKIYRQIYRIKKAVERRYRKYLQ